MEENQKIKISLNLAERFDLINFLGIQGSRRKTLLSYINLIGELSLTKEEASNEALELKYIQSTNSFSWKEGILADIEIELDTAIYSSILMSLIYTPEPNYRNLHDKFVKARS